MSRGLDNAVATITIKTDEKHTFAIAILRTFNDRRNNVNYRHGIIIAQLRLSGSTALALRQDIIKSFAC